MLIFCAFALCLLRLAIVGIIIARGSKRHQDVGPNQRAQSAHTSSIVAGSIGGNHVQMSCYRKTQHSCRRAPRPRRRSRQCPRGPRAISEGLGCQPVGRSAGESQDDEKRFRHYRIFVIVSAQSLALVIELVTRAFSSEVDTGSREENASKQEIRASVLIQSEPILL